jgi:hypothetical protein
VLDHQRVHVQKADLKQVQGQHQKLLVLELIAGVTTRKCQNCPVRESQTWTILGVEREFGSIERVEDTAEGIWSSLQGEKRPLDCLISIAKQSFSADCRLGQLENRVSARIAERASIAAA